LGQVAAQREIRGISCNLSISTKGEEKTMKVQIDARGQAKSLKRRPILYTASKRGSFGVLSAGRHSQAMSRRSEVGSALVELAVTMPILLMLVTGICSFGLAFNHQLTLTSAVGAGGQYLQLIRTSTTDPCADTLTAIENAAPGLSAAGFSLTFNLNGNTVTGNSCPGDQSYLTQGTPVSVSATYPCSLSIFGTRFSSACQLSAKVTEYEY